MARNGNLLIVEDNTENIIALQMFLEDEFHNVTAIKTPTLIPGVMQNNVFDIVLLDMNFASGVNNGNEGMFWLKEIQKLDSSVCVIMMTAYGDIDLAVKAMKNGATDFVLKPWENDRLLATLKAALKLRQSNLEIQKLRVRQNHLEAEIDHLYPEIIGQCPAMLRIMEIIDKVSRTDVNILLTGENGTGKGLIAREIHKRSGRKNEVMITVDMASIPLTLFESELFGHRRGAFTDARQDRVGRFETASGGTLFLDEIGNLSLNMQTKILNVLQERHLTPLGSNKAVPIDVRLICATNKNLDKMVVEGLFRQDLLFRINTIQIDLPPLRERDGDIEIMAESFLKRYLARYEREPMEFSKEAIAAMRAYSWPGNIRELEHSVEKAVILSEHPVIKAEDLYLKKVPYHQQAIPDIPLSFDHHEKDLIRKALLKNMGNLASAARELGISRQTIYNKMKKYGL